MYIYGSYRKIKTGLSLFLDHPGRPTRQIDGKCNVSRKYLLWLIIVVTLLHELTFNKINRRRICIQIHFSISGLSYAVVSRIKQNPLPTGISGRGSYIASYTRYSYIAPTTMIYINLGLLAETPSAKENVINLTCNQTYLKHVAFWGNPSAFECP